MSITNEEIDIFFKKVVAASKVSYLESCIESHNNTIKSDGIKDNVNFYVIDELYYSPFKRDMFDKFMINFYCDIDTEINNNDGCLYDGDTTVDVDFNGLSTVTRLSCSYDFNMYSGGKSYTYNIGRGEWLKNIGTFYETVPLWKSLMHDCIKFINNPILLNVDNKKENPITEQEEISSDEEEEDDKGYNTNEPMYKEYSYIFPQELYDIMIDKSKSNDDKIKEVHDYLNELISGYIYDVVRYVVNQETHLNYSI